MDAPTPTPAPKPPRAPWQRVARVASMVAVSLLIVGALVAAVVGTLWRSEGGTRWLLQHVPGVTAVDVHGSVGGGDLRVGSLRVRAGSVQVDASALHLGGLVLHWLPSPGTWLRVSMDALEADAVHVTLLPSTTPATKSAPASLRSPVALDVAALRVGTLAIADNPPLRDVQAALAIGAESGASHRVDHLRFAWERVAGEASAQLRTDGAHALAVTLDAHDIVDTASAPARLPHWSATATLNGPLAGFDASAKLQGDALPGRAAPRVQASAHVTPFDTLPVSAVLLETTELDLSALSARAPATRLQGHLRVATTQPAALDADLHNLAPAALSAGGLPFSALTGHLEAPWNGAFIAIPSLRLALADAQGAGGELRAQGRWEGDKAQIELTLDQVQPQRLSAQAGAWRISGPLRAEIEHLPAPGSLWGAAPAAASAAAAASSASAPSAFAATTAHLTGKLAGTAPVPTSPNALVPPPMTLQLDALLRADALQLKQFDLKAGQGMVSAQGSAARGATGNWQGDAKAQWAQLDPGAWYRLADSGPLRDGTTLLNGTLALQLANAPAAWSGLAGLRGKAELVLADSQLAGLALAGKATLDGLQSPWTVDAELHSGGNTARLAGAIRPGRAGDDALAVIDQLHLGVDAPALQVLAPLGGHAAATPAVAAASAVDAMAASRTIPGTLIAEAATKVATGGKTTDARALAPALAASAAKQAAETGAAPAGWPTHGAAKFEVDVTGGRLAIADTGRDHAPATPMRLVTHGELTDWAGPSLRLAQLRWDARASTDPQAPLEASVTLVDGQSGITHIAHAQATLSGTLANHQLQLQGDAPVSPPLWLANLASIGKANATRLDALLQGRWNPQAVDAPAWRGHLAQFDLRAATAASAASAPARAASMSMPANEAPWVHVTPFDIDVTRDAAGDFQTARVSPGRAEFAGLALSWQPSFWTAPTGPGASARWSIDAALAPFSIAQLMARAQPDLGWHGDLQMDAKLHAAFDGRWHVAAQAARTSGDLGVSELVTDAAGGKQALGLTRALVQVKAEGADWVADADIAGTRLGEFNGHWTAEAPSPASLPTPESPLKGSVKAHVDDLNVWGGWMPPGWRLGGEARADLALSGRWGAPRINGEISASKLAIRNALEGVYGHDGEAAIRLTGDEAQIERFRVVGGNGELTLAGGARLGAVPQARLQLRAREFQLLGRIDRKIVTTGNVDLQLAADAIKVTGKLGIDEGLIDLSKGDAPTLDSDVEVLAPTPATAQDDAADAAAAVPKTGRATAIDLALDLGDKLQLRGRGIDTQLKGTLQISSPGGVLAVRGDVHTEGGQYLAYGQKLDITRGQIFFTGPVGDPRLDILATRPNLDVVVGVAITGTALAPHVKLYSEPEMTDAYKLSWLMLGREPESASGPDVALLQQAAMALLAGEGEAPSDQVLQRLGLTSFAVGQQTNADNVKQTVVSLGRQVSKRIYVGYERSVTTTSGNWQLIYRIAQRLTVRAQAGVDATTTSTANPNGSSSVSLDMIYTWRWN